MKVFVTGGAGFIGRWLVKKLLEDGHDVWVLDDLSNGSLANLEEMKGHGGLQIQVGDIKQMALVDQLFDHGFDICYHLGASINVQDSIDDPRTTFENDTLGTFNVLEACRKYRVKMVFMSTCMVYDRANTDAGLRETDPVKPASPYAGAKIAAENMVLSYFHAYQLPVVVVRPFNTYGPFQKSGGEGGVVSIFIQRKLTGKSLDIYGTGTQTRDLLYVEDCARFVAMAGYSDAVNGEIVNAGLGRDVSINELALHICQDEAQIRHIPHIHPQSEIQRLLCNYDKAAELLNWQPQVSLEEGLRRTEQWLLEH
jgi:UDP-glucose 4-epimerase